MKCDVCLKYEFTVEEITTCSLYGEGLFDRYMCGNCFKLLFGSLFFENVPSKGLLDSPKCYTCNKKVSSMYIGFFQTPKPYSHNRLYYCLNCFEKIAGRDFVHSFKNNTIAIDFKIPVVATTEEIWRESILKATLKYEKLKEVYEKYLKEKELRNDTM